MRSHPITFLLAALLGSCADAKSATEVLVVVDSNLEVGSALTDLRITAYDRNGASEVARQDFALSTMVGPARFPLPLSFSLTPSDGVRQFRLVVTGQGPKNGAQRVDIVERQAFGSFGSGKRLFLPVFLDDRCRDELCRGAGEPPGDLTCDVGKCIPIPPEPDGGLPSAGPGPIGPYQPPVDDAGADASFDAGDADAGHDASHDASDAELDAGDADAGDADAGDADAGDADAGDAGVDAGYDAGPQPCGAWVQTMYTATPPASATSYGVEYNDNPPGTFNQYVCRVQVAPGIFVPGKGVFGYSCYYTALDGTQQYNADFEVLVDSASCATMKPVRSTVPAYLLPTGNDANGPLYSCRAPMPSPAMDLTPPRDVSYPLGRYDVANDRCVYEWYGTTRYSGTDANGNPTFYVLSR